MEDAQKDISQGARAWPGDRLYRLGRQILMFSFLALFLLIAHQKFFTGYRRSKEKLMILMIIGPFVPVGGVCAFAGWWRMRSAGAFSRRSVAEEGEQRERERRRQRQDAELLPWQRRH